MCVRAGYEEPGVREAALAMVEEETRRYRPTRSGGGDKSDLWTDKSDLLTDKSDLLTDKSDLLTNRMFCSQLYQRLAGTTWSTCPA
jgi:hypothetical protein